MMATAERLARQIRVAAGPHDNPDMSVQQIVSEMAERIAELEEFAREIIKQYPNPDITHEQFRVHACRHAAAVIEQDCEGGTT